MFDRLLSVVVAVVLAFLIWLHARSRDQDTLDNVPIQVLIVLPKEYESRYALQVNGPSQISAMFHGTPARLREVREKLSKGELLIAIPYTIPSERAGEVRYLDTVAVRSEDLPVVAGVRGSVLLGQNRIPITVRKIVERPLQVRLEHALEERVTNLTIEPATVVVRGPAEVLERSLNIGTRSHTLPPGTPTDSLQEVAVQGRIGLTNTIDGHLVHTEPAIVNFKYTLTPRRKVYEVKVPVHFLCPVECPWQPKWLRTRGTTSDPGMLTLKVVGPNRQELPKIHAYVDLTLREFQFLGDLRPRQYQDEAIHIELPKDFQLAQSIPKSDAFMLSPRPAQQNSPLGIPLDGILTLP